ncbi:MAG: hypothetical protein MUF42_02345 [Cytophagaceae bacterium]|jgi:hypothetical protein|nr:hypothetical protein [Cytophagaceae bacterium]
MNDSIFKKWLNAPWLIPLLSLVGVGFGYLYWYYWGCASGTCVLQDYPYRTMLIGGLLTYLIADSVIPWLRQKFSSGKER